MDDCGGWCPAGRLDEFGRIPHRYPVKELEEGVRRAHLQKRQRF